MKNIKYHHIYFGFEVYNIILLYLKLKYHYDMKSIGSYKVHIIYI